MAGPYIENYVPAIRLAKGINTKKGITVGGSANFDMSGSTGTFKTPTGAATLGGNVTISGSGTFTSGTGAVALNGTTTVATGKTLVVTDTAALTLGGAIVPVYEYVTSPVFAAASFVSGTAYPIYTFPNDSITWKVKAVSLRYTTASSSGTVDLGVSADTVAPASATTQLTGTMSTAGTANTTVNGTIKASPDTISGGATLVLTSGGTVTGLVNMVVTIALQRLS